MTTTMTSTATTPLSPHLKDLENESIHILREVAGQFDRVALLFSGGKDSVVVFELARRAFAPAAVPFELLHVDTGHNFPEVIEFRDRLVEQTGARLRVAAVQDWIDRGDVVERPDGTRNPLQTIPLVDTINEVGYGAVLGGARRDEERARAKERVFSVRDSFGGWDPRRQRPELWNLYNGEHRNCGICTTASTCLARTFACFPSPIGRKRMCGNTSAPVIFSYHRSILRTSAKSSNATACG